MVQNLRKPGWRERLNALRNLPAFFKLVWASSPWMTLLNIGLRLLRSTIPVSILYIGKGIIDEVILLNRAGGIHSTQHLWFLIGAEFFLAIFNDALGRSISLLDSMLGDLFGKLSSVRIMKHAALLDLEQFEDPVFYDKLERARQQTTGRTILLSQVLSQVQDLITMGFLAAGLIIFNPWLIAILFISIIPSFIGESYFNDQTYALSRRQTPERRELDYLRFLGASDETAKEVKIFNLSAFIIGKFEALANKFYISNRRISINRSVWGTIFTLLGSLGYYGAYVYIILETISGAISIGQLTFLAGSFRQLKSLMESVLSRFSSVSQGAIYLSDFFEFFEIKPGISSVENPIPFPDPVKTGFEFRNVGFRYQHGEKWASRHLNFILKAGEKIALVGENGAGKTTLVKLLARLYDPTEGTILLDGVDLRLYDLVSLRRNIGIIFQDYLRYQMKMSDNIAVGNIQQKENKPLIETAASLSLASDLVNRLPAGYDQMLGKRFQEGIELSGGEWQKVALARAYMREAQVLILDEPTSALDARAEYEVFQRFASLTRGKMAVLISHRFSTVRMADRILVLQDGKLIESGTHLELIEKKGKYAELFTLQAKGYQ
jgi:ATP-binding cassette, subfamily B, bacterial